MTCPCRDQKSYLKITEFLVHCVENNKWIYDK
jgi:hypothetical protein